MAVELGDAGSLALFLAVAAMGAGVVIAGAIAYQRAQQARLARIRAWVASRGWSWTARDDALAELLGTRPFGMGDEREAREVITGSRGGRPFQAFRYVVVDHSRDSKGRRKTRREDFQVVWVTLPRSLPALRFAPDDALQRVLTGLGWGDVDTESHAFNQRWRVSARDDAYAHAILAPHVIEELLRPAWAGATLVIEGRFVAVVRPGYPDLRTLDGTLERLEALTGTIPPFVLADYGR
ncbi:hypothetical protein QQX09_08965 [Demequina sp. SYSU T00192]|uniref:Uncharacterized protein n=1 Tax=Demequina litoralis TaxID=3051660 RepID=A0ABT8GBE7_9MICO|nr:hypothetical protein [Demequina sp. SYSU T00192]MDN4475984.1 hypothetical protein [Demequina sp. SYSU T00192]